LEGDTGNTLLAVYPEDEGIDTKRIENAVGKMPTGASLVKWTLVFTKDAQKDSKKLLSAGLKTKTERLLEIIRNNPYQNPPPYEKLVGDLAGAYSRRINIHHRLVYQIFEANKTVKIIRMWTHYE
jgi:toxin YoeB